MTRTAELLGYDRDTVRAAVKEWHNGGEESIPVKDGAGQPRQRPAGFLESCGAGRTAVVCVQLELRPTILISATRKFLHHGVISF